METANQPTEELSAPKSKFWEALKDAIKGSEADYTQISLKKSIFLLAIPMILELVMESIFAVVDIYFVGKLGPSAAATVGLTETYMFLLYAIAMGMSMAVTGIIARRVGEKNKEQAGLSAVQAIILSLLISVPFMVAGIFFSKELLALMGADEWALTEGIGYAQWMLGANVIVVLLFVINSIFRGAGDAAIAMRVLIIANLINIFLDPALIFGWGPFPELGIEGAAIATNIGRGLGVAIQIWVLIKGGKHLKIKLEQVVWHAKTMLHIIKTSLGGIGQMMIAMVSWNFVLRILADIGSEPVAASTIVIRVMMFTMMPAWGLSNAAATLVGQNLGAGNPKRAESAVWTIGLINMVFLVGVSFVYFFLSKDIMMIFSEDAQVIAIGAEWLQILSYSYFVYGWWMVAVQAFNGAGDTKTPTWINLIFFWFIQIPLAYLLAIQWNWEYSGVFWAVFFSETAVGICTILLFKRGKWKTVEV